MKRIRRGFSGKTGTVIVSTYLLFPALQFLNQVVVALVHLAELGVHAALEVDEVLPRLQSIARVLIPLADDLIEVAHGDLSHQRLLDRASEHSLQPCVTTLVVKH